MIATLFIFVFLGSNVAMISNAAIIQLGPKVTIAELGSDSSTREFRKTFEQNNLLNGRVSYKFVNSLKDLNEISSAILIVVGHGSDNGVIFNGKVYDWNALNPRSKLTILAMCHSSKSPLNAIKFPGIVDSRLAAVISKIILYEAFGFQEQANQMVKDLLRSDAFIDWLVDPQYPLGSGDWSVNWNPSAMISYKFMVGLGVVGLLGIIYTVIKPVFSLADLAYAIICYLLDAIMDIILHKIPDALSIVKDTIKTAVKALVGGVFYYFVGPASEGLNTLKGSISLFLKKLISGTLNLEERSVQFRILETIYAVLYYIFKAKILKDISDFYGGCASAAENKESAKKISEKIRKWLKKNAKELKKAENKARATSIPVGALMAYELASLGETVASITSSLSEFIFGFNLETHGFHMKFKFYFKFHYYNLVKKSISKQLWWDTFTLPSISSIVPSSGNSSGGSGGGGGTPIHPIVAR